MKPNTLTRSLLVVLLIITTSQVQAQRKGYIKTVESGYERGTISFNKKRPTEVILEYSSSAYSSYDISEVESFGFFRRFGKDSIVYEPTEIDMAGIQQTVFLKKLVPGLNVLLQLDQKEKRFFLKQGGEVTELTRNNYKEIIKKLVPDTKQWAYQAERVRFTSGDLVQFFFALNTRGEFVTGLTKTQLVSSLVKGQISFGTITGLDDFISNNTLDLQEISFGISHYVPLQSSKRIGIISQLNFERYALTTESRANNRNKSFAANFDRLLFEITPTYRLNSNRFSAYLFGGFMGGIVLNSNSEYFEADLSVPNLIVFDGLTNPLNHDTIHLGIAFGAGLDVILSSKIVASLEYRLNRSKHGSIDNISTNKLTFKIGL